MKDRDAARKALEWLLEVNLDTTLMRERALDRATDAILEAKAEEAEYLQMYCLANAPIWNTLTRRIAELRAQKSTAIREGK